jgi:hypothetical protein
LAGQIVEKNDAERAMMNNLSANLMTKIMGMNKKKKK